MLEAHGTGGGPDTPESLPLFAAAAPAPLAAVAEPMPEDAGLAEVAALLEDSDPDSMTPRQAHDLLYRLRDLLRD